MQKIENMKKQLQQIKKKLEEKQWVITTAKNTIYLFLS